MAGMSIAFMNPMPVTQVTAAAAIFLNTWLGWRTSKLRHQFGVSVGDGGHEPLVRRMRAQANYIENAPLFLIALAAIEVSGLNKQVLAAFAFVFILARIAHAVGMDGGAAASWRKYGIIAQTVAIVGIAILALLDAALQIP